MALLPTLSSRKWYEHIARNTEAKEYGKIKLHNIRKLDPDQA